jgi:hypothetical protein
MLFASFRTVDGMFESWFNRIAAYVTGGQFCHSEFIFKWSPAERDIVLERCHGFTMLRTPMRTPMRTERTDVGEPMYICIDTMWGRAVDYRILTPSACDEYWQLPTQHQVHIPCSFEDEVRLIKWLQEQQGKIYDRMGALTCWMPFSLRPDSSVYRSYFCSQLMVCALCATSLMSPETQRTIQNRANVTPNRLHALLTDIQQP